MMDDVLTTNMLLQPFEELDHAGLLKLGDDLEHAEQAVSDLIQHIMSTTRRAPKKGRMYTQIVTCIETDVRHRRRSLANYCARLAKAKQHGDG